MRLGTQSMMPLLFHTFRERIQIVILRYALRKRSLMKKKKLSNERDSTILFDFYKLFLDFNQDTLDKIINKIVIIFLLGLTRFFRIKLFF